MTLFKSAAVLFCLQLLAVGASAQAEAFAAAGDVSALAGAGVVSFDTTYVQPITSAFAGANPYNAAAAISTALANNQAASILQAFTQVCKPHFPAISRPWQALSVVSLLCLLCRPARASQAATACTTHVQPPKRVLVVLQAKSSNVQVVLVCDCYNYSQKISQAVAQACAEAIASTYGGSTCSNLSSGSTSAQTSTSTSGSGAEAAASAGK